MTSYILIFNTWRFGWTDSLSLFQSFRFPRVSYNELSTNCGYQGHASSNLKFYIFKGVHIFTPLTFWTVSSTHIAFPQIPMMKYMDTNLFRFFRLDGKRMEGVTRRWKYILKLFRDRHRCKIRFKGKWFHPLEILWQVFEKRNFLVPSAPWPRDTLSEIVMWSPYQRLQIIFAHLRSGDIRIIIVHVFLLLIIIKHR